MSRRFLIVSWISTWGFGQSIIKYSAVSCHQDSWRRDSRCPPPSAMHIVTTSMHSRTTVKVNILDTHIYIKKERIRIHRKTKDLKRAKEKSLNSHMTSSECTRPLRSGCATECASAYSARTVAAVGTRHHTSDDTESLSSPLVTICGTRAGLFLSHFRTHFIGQSCVTVISYRE